MKFMNYILNYLYYNIIVTNNYAYIISIIIVILIYYLDYIIYTLLYLFYTSIKYFNTLLIHLLLICLSNIC